MRKTHVALWGLLLLVGTGSLLFAAGFDDSILSGLSTTVADTLYCQLTGCTMTGTLTGKNATFDGASFVDYVNISNRIGNGASYLKIGATTASTTGYTEAGDVATGGDIYSGGKILGATSGQFSGIIISGATINTGGGSAGDLITLGGGTTTIASMVDIKTWSNGTGAFTATSGTQYGVRITPKYNQASGTASNVDLYTSRTETAVGSGDQYLYQANVSTTEKFGVMTDGRIRTVNCTTVQLINSSDASRAKGTVVAIDASTDCGFEVAGAASTIAVGVLAETCADNAQCDVCIGGYAQALTDSNGATRSEWCGVSGTAGTVDCTTNDTTKPLLGAAMGKACENKAGGALAWIFLQPGI